MNEMLLLAELLKKHRLETQEKDKRIAELAAQVQHLTDINTERQLRIRQLQAMIIKNQAEDLKEQE